MYPKDANEMANSVESDQTAASSEAVWSESTLFVQTCLSKELGSVW